MTTPDESGSVASGGTAEDTDFTFADAKDFVDKEWERVWKTKASLEQRAITLITTSGVLVTLAFGFTAAVTKGQTFSSFTTAERAVLVVALALFALSALISLQVNLPKGYSVPDFRDLLGITDAPIAGKPLQRLNNAISKATALNDSKAQLLALAFTVQLAAIAALAVVIAIVTA